MTFSEFTLTELPDDADNDYQVDLVMNESRHGFCVTETELRMLSDAFEDTLDEDAGVIDQRSVEEYKEADA